MDFRSAVVDALDRLIASDAVTKMIEQQLEKTMRDIVEHELRSYSDFGKRLTEEVKKSLALNGSLDLPSYNDAIIKVVRAQLETMTKDTIQKQVAENLVALLEPAPESITLSDLTAKYIEQLKRMQSSGCVCYGDSHEITLRVDESDYGFKYVELSDEPNKSRYGGDIRIGVDKDGKVFSLAFRDQDLEKRMFVGPFHGFEKMLFQMKAAGSKLVFDEEPDYISTSYALHDD